MLSDEVLNKQKQVKIFSEILLERQGQHLALTVLCVPRAVDSGIVTDPAHQAAMLSDEVTPTSAAEREGEQLEIF
jgi:hypothetical protein